MLKKVSLFLLFSLVFQTSFSQNRRSHWVDSVFSTLSREHKIGQLLMVPVAGNLPKARREELVHWARTQSIGSIYVTGGGPLRHASILNELQRSAPIPLLVGASAEWGLSQTLDSIPSLHKPLVAASWKDDSLRTLWANAIAQQMKLLGVHINFAPNADNEIFSGDYLRYFGQDEQLVAAKTLAFTRAMQGAGILSVAKHLPRKPSAGLTLKDTTLLLSIHQIDSVGFLPFRNLLTNGVRGILTSSLHFSITTEKHLLPVAISPVFISDIIRNKLNYQGLVFADVHAFQHSSGKVRNGDADLLALETGNDVLMNPTNVSAAIRKIARKLKRDKKLQLQVDSSVRKILEAKYDAGLARRPQISTDNLLRNLHTPALRLLNYQLAAAAVTVVKNEDNLLPLGRLEDQLFSSVSIGAPANNTFTQFLRKYASIQTWSMTSLQDTSRVTANPNSIVFVDIHPYAAELALSLTPWLTKLAAHQPVIIVNFGNPSLAGLYPEAAAIIEAYTDQDELASVVPQVIFGGLSAQGKLPVQAGTYPVNTSINTVAIDRLSYSPPESASMDSQALNRINDIMQEAIALGGTPGCQVIVARKGKVVFDQSAGWLTYENKTPVTDETIYDLASLTKVSATLQTAMFLYEKGLLDLNKKVSFYLPELKITNKKDITLIDMLTHQSGLVPFIPLWPLTVKDSVFMPEFYSTSRNDQYPLQVASGLFATRSIRDSVWTWILRSKMQEKPPRTPYSYRYSDLGFMIMKQVAEKILNQPMDEFLVQNFYEPLGAFTTGFNPLDRFSPLRIAPTEDDKIYRKSLVVGTVHDERAAMMGGVSGHAGLFSTANDLVKLGQMLLQEGHYGGEVYFKPETVRLFANKQFQDSRRGIGWDKPQVSDWSSPTSLWASPRTFGHTGFTGTCLWIDPEFDLVYVFLSNRVFPDRNTKLLNANIRSRIQDEIYRSIFDYCDKSSQFSPGQTPAGQ